MMPAEDVPMLAFEINTTVLLFTSRSALGTALLFGLFPALHGVRTGIAAGIHAQSTARPDREAPNRFRTSLATAQIALATALLAMAGLFVVSLVNLARSELGIRREGSGHVPAVAISQRLLAGTRAGAVRACRGRAARDPRRRRRHLVHDPGAGRQRMEQQRDGRRLRRRTGRPTRPSPSTRHELDYFRTLGIPMLAGREFTRADDAGAPKVAIVNEAFARKFNLGSQVDRQAHGDGRRRQSAARHRDRRAWSVMRSTAR